MYGLLPILLFSPKNWSLWLQKALLSATLIETPFSLSTLNYKGSLATSEPQQKCSTQCKKGIHHPCNLTFHLLQPQKLPHGCSPLTQKKGKKKPFPQSTAEVHLAAGCQPDTARGTAGRNRALLLKREGEAIH